MEGGVEEGVVVWGFGGGERPKKKAPGRKLGAWDSMGFGDPILNRGDKLFGRFGVVGGVGCAVDDLFGSRSSISSAAATATEGEHFGAFGGGIPREPACVGFSGFVGFGGEGGVDDFGGFGRFAGEGDHVGFIGVVPLPGFPIRFASFVGFGGEGGVDDFGAGDGGGVGVLEGIEGSRRIGGVFNVFGDFASGCAVGGVDVVFVDGAVGFGGVGAVGGVFVTGVIAFVLGCCGGRTGFLAEGFLGAVGGGGGVADEAFVGDFEAFDGDGVLGNV